MNAKTPILILALVGATILWPTGAQAQGKSTENGQESEFGVIRTPYSTDMNGQRVDITAKVVLRQNYEEKDARIFMFAWNVQNTPLDVNFDSLVRTDTGQELPCFQREGTSRDQIKCFVDIKDMPPAGGQIVMKASVGSSKLGGFNIGAEVVPFTYLWGRVPMKNGLNAELYSATMINVNSATSKGGAVLGGLGNKVPGLELGATVAAVAAVALLASRRKK